MESALLHHLRQWDRRMNGLPRKALLIALTLLAAAALFWLLPYCWPFALAALFAMLLEKPVCWMRRGFGRVKPPRSLCALLGMLLLFGVAGLLATVTLTRLTQELIALLRQTPQLIAWLATRLCPG